MRTTGSVSYTHLVDELHDTGIIQTECRTVAILTVGIVTHAEDFRLFGIVDVQMCIRDSCQSNTGRFPL